MGEGSQRGGADPREQRTERRIAGEPAATTTRLVPRAARPTGTKSVSGSYGSFFRSTTFIATGVLLEKNSCET